MCLPGTVEQVRASCDHHSTPHHVSQRAVLTAGGAAALIGFLPAPAASPRCGGRDRGFSATIKTGPVARRHIVLDDQHPPLSIPHAADSRHPPCRPTGQSVNVSWRSWSCGHTHHMTLTLDLHPVFRSDRDIDRAVRGILFEAVRTKAPLVEIIPGKGTGQLKKRVLALLGQQHLRKLYRRLETDSTNSGRIYVHFR